ERERDAAGRVTRVAYSSGWEVGVDHAATSWPARIKVKRDDTGTTDSLVIEHDGIGRRRRLRREEVAQAVEQEHDSLGRLTVVRVTRGDRTLAERRYGWAAQDVLETIDDSR